MGSGGVLLERGGYLFGKVGNTLDVYVFFISHGLSNDIGDSGSRVKRLLLFRNLVKNYISEREREVFKVKRDDGYLQEYK